MFVGVIAGVLLIIGGFSLLISGGPTNGVTETLEKPGVQQQAAPRFVHPELGPSSEKTAEIPSGADSPDLAASRGAPSGATVSSRQLAAVAAKANVAAAPTVANPGAKEQWAVQVGSLRTRSEAEQKLSGVLDRGYKGFVEEALVQGSAVYRVKLGPFSSKAAANESRKSALQNPDMVGAFVSKLQASDQ